ncbi:hypothetical protein HCU74_14715 [Spongiibacter sp. KMU-166]|uniref:Chromosome partition protein Smc n=1 Tax=Spongiibacter thalassae TaxID=2721624 RepID=A0ABX1GHG9_9GAMM|nr:hypothetical protein [Spongiibacter thalassae]
MEAKSLGPLNGKIEDVQDLKRDFEDAVTKYRDFQHKNEQLAENMAVMTIQKADISKELAVLSQVLETTKAELKTCKDKIAFLTDENKVILQEKAMIQGQFKQLQDSL